MQQVTNPDITVANPDEPLSFAAIKSLAKMLLSAVDTDEQDVEPAVNGAARAEQ